MEIGHLLFLHSLSQAEVKTEFHHCMSLVYVGGNLGPPFFFSLGRGGREREQHDIETQASCSCSILKGFRGLQLVCHVLPPFFTVKGRDRKIMQTSSLLLISTK